MGAGLVPVIACGNPPHGIPKVVLSLPKSPLRGGNAIVCSEFQLQGYSIGIAVTQWDGGALHTSIGTCCAFC